MTLRLVEPDEDDEYVVEPGYDPWPAVDDALDAGTDPVFAQDLECRFALEWLYAESGQSHADYLREYDEKRRDEPFRRAWRRSYMRRYMQDYRKRRKAA